MGSSFGSLISLDNVLGDASSWHFLLAIPMIFGFTECIVAGFLPDSPAYLLARGSKQTAAESIK